VILSRFAKCFEIGDSVALYHSLRMKPVFLKVDKYNELLTFLDKSEFSVLSDFPHSVLEEIQELFKYKILVKNADEDEKVLNFIRSKIPEPSISVCYFILSEQCNLACKHCFLGNNAPEKRKKFSLQAMTKESAEKSIMFFIKQLEISSNDSLDNKPNIIFYGGEPLINFPVLEYVAERINDLKQKVKCIENIELSVVTNGLLLDIPKLNRLKELNVALAISIDGCTEEANAMRVDMCGNPSFPKVIEALDKIKEAGVDVSLSITLTEETIKDKQKILDLITVYGIKGLGFNILMSDESFKLSDEYNENAAQFIIDMFIELRKIGVYEDRIMRKIKAFSKSQIYFSDCAATSGSQIVITPDGNVGVCHGCLSNRQFFVSSINDEVFNASTNPVFMEWAQLTPVNKPECLSCEALGICGGGCPVNAMRSHQGNTIHSRDDRFCVHAKKTLAFLIKDLYKIVSKSEG
jgi:uncharacterized protein